MAIETRLLPEVVVFGGAFDPPHAAHVAAVAATLTRFPEAQVLVLPGAAPAVAGGGAKEPEASFADRFAMTQLAFAPLGPRVAVQALEAELPRPNYTVDTLRAVAQRYPQKRLGLLIGQDQAAAFPRWRAPEEILKLATLVILGRRSPAGEAPFGALDEALSRLFGTLPPARDQHFVLVALDAGPAASHVVREQLAAGTTPPKDWLPEPVAAYIRHHALYGAKPS